MSSIYRLIKYFDDANLPFKGEAVYFDINHDHVVVDHNYDEHHENIKISNNDFDNILKFIGKERFMKLDRYLPEVVSCIDTKEFYKYIMFLKRIKKINKINEI